MDRLSIEDIGQSAKRLLKRIPLVRDLVRQHRLTTGQPKWEGLLSQNSTYEEALRRALASDRRVLLTTSGGGYLAGTRIESLLAVALTLRGVAAHVLLCDGVLPACLECEISWYPNERVFAAEGPTRRHCRACFAPADQMYQSLGVPVHRYSNFLTGEDLRQAEAIAMSVPAAEIGGYRLDGLAVGEHALAGALRFYARATLAVPHAEAVLRRYFHAALLTASVARRLLHSIEFDCVTFHHGLYVPQGILGEVARQEGRRVVNWHVAYRKRRFIFSHGDTYHHTLINEPVESWEHMPWTPSMEQELMQYLQSRWYGTNDWISFQGRPQVDLASISRETGVDFSRPCVGMLTNVMWDAQLHYPANAFPNMLDWTIETIAYFARRPDLQLLIRVHPAEVRGTIPSRQPITTEIRRAFPLLPPNVFIIAPQSRASTYAMMSQCDAVLIYGTKTGVELTAMGIPVIVAGEAWIRNKGITFDARSRDEYFSLLDSLPLRQRLGGEIVQRARKYAYHFFFRRMIPLDFIIPTAGIPGFEVHVSSLGELLPRASLGLDVICDGILHGTEFVYPQERFVGRPGRTAGARLTR